MGHTPREDDAERWIVRMILRKYDRLKKCPCDRNLNPVHLTIISILDAPSLTTHSSFIGFVYIWMIWNQDRSRWQWKVAVAVNVFIVIVGFFIQIAGTYTAVLSIIDNVNSGTNR